MSLEEFKNIEDPYKAKTFGTIHYFRLERLSRLTNLNHFALKSKLYIKALAVSFRELQKIRKQIGVCV